MAGAEVAALSSIPEEQRPFCRPHTFMAGETGTHKIWQRDQVWIRAPIAPNFPILPLMSGSPLDMPQRCMPRTLVLQQPRPGAGRAPHIVPHFSQSGSLPVWAASAWGARAPGAPTALCLRAGAGARAGQEPGHRGRRALRAPVPEEAHKPHGRRGARAAGLGADVSSAECARGPRESGVPGPLWPVQPLGGGRVHESAESSHPAGSCNPPAVQARSVPLCGRAYGQPSLCDDPCAQGAVPAGRRVLASPSTRSVCSYIGRKRMQVEEPEKPVPAVPNLVEADYSYWTLGYVISLAGARKLVGAEPFGKMLPVDEFLPIMYDKHPV